MATWRGQKEMREHFVIAKTSIAATAAVWRYDFYFAHDDRVVEKQIAVTEHKNKKV